MKNIKNYEFFTNLAYEFGFNVVGITPAQTTNLNQKGLDEFIQKKYWKCIYRTKHKGG